MRGRSIAMRKYGSKLMKCLLSVLATVISAYVVRYYQLDGAGAQPPLLVVNAVVDKIGAKFRGTEQGDAPALKGDVPALTGQSDSTGSVRLTSVNSNRESDQDDRRSAARNAAKNAEPLVVPAHHQVGLRDEGAARRSGAAAPKIASINVRPRASSRANPDRSAISVGDRVVTASPKAKPEDISLRTSDMDELPLSEGDSRARVGSLWHLPDLWLARAREHDRLRSLSQRFHNLFHLIQTEVVD